MYCPKCGAENPDNAQLCQSCSWVLSSTSTGPADDAKTSTLAIWSFVLGIVSIFTLFLTTLPAIICGIIGLVKISKSKGQLKGTGLAIAGIAVPAATGLFIVPMMLAIMMPALGRAKGLAQRTICGTNLSGISKAMLLYANDYDEKYPTPNWCNLLIDYADVDERQFVCPGAKEGPCNYAMNVNIIELGTAAPPDMVLLFETSPGWNQIGGPEILTTENHHGEGCNIVFADSHVEFVKPERLEFLRWTVEQNKPLPIPASK